MTAPPHLEKKIEKSWQSIRKPQWRCRIFAIELKRQTLYGENRPFSPLRAKLRDSIARTCFASANLKASSHLLSPCTVLALWFETHHAEWTNSTRRSAQFDTPNRKTRQASPKWTKLTNQNHENEHESLELNESFFVDDNPIDCFACKGWYFLKHSESLLLRCFQTIATHHLHKKYHYKFV